jgi:hypothetical protein
MRRDKRACAAATLLAAFMGSAAMAATANDWGFLNADSSVNGKGPMALQLAGISVSTGPGFALPFSERPPQLTLVKNTQKASPAEVCAAKCKKAYRYCYSRGNQIGKPYVTGGQPCSEQKLMCMRACPQ